MSDDREVVTGSNGVKGLSGELHQPENDVDEVAAQISTWIEVGEDWVRILACLQGMDPETNRFIFLKDDEQLFRCIMLLTATGRVPVELVRLVLSAMPAGKVCDMGEDRTELPLLLEVAKNMETDVDPMYCEQLFDALLDNATEQSLRILDQNVSEFSLWADSLLMWLPAEIGNCAIMESIVCTLLQKFPRMAFATGDDDDDPLYMVCQLGQRQKNLSLEVIKELVQLNPDALHRTYGGNEDQSTCLHAICDHCLASNEEPFLIAQFLLECDVTMARKVDGEGKIPLDCAVKHRSPLLADLLLKRCPDVLDSAERRCKVVKCASTMYSKTICLHLLLDHDPTLAAVVQPSCGRNALGLWLVEYFEEVPSWMRDVSEVEDDDDDDDALFFRDGAQEAHATCQRLIDHCWEAAGVSGLGFIAIRPDAKRRGDLSVPSVTSVQLQMMQIMASAWCRSLHLRPEQLTSVDFSYRGGDWGSDGNFYEVELTRLTTKLLPMDHLLTGLIVGQAQLLVLAAYLRAHPRAVGALACIKYADDAVTEYKDYSLHHCIRALTSRLYKDCSKVWSNDQGGHWTLVEDKVVSDVLKRIIGIELAAVAALVPHMIGQTVLCAALCGRYPLRWSQGLDHLVTVVPTIMARRDPTTGLYPFQLACLSAATKHTLDDGVDKSPTTTPAGLGLSKQDGFRPEPVRELETAYCLLRASVDDVVKLLQGEC